ncbi:hypothetical protein [Citrobacter youngae]|uniref:hypothetical protein n=1 Tax=Citrobacter youngae TaxID=133448 RepID=UPI00397A6D75
MILYSYEMGYYFSTKILKIIPMDKAIIIKKKAINSRPQWALIIYSSFGYSVCVVDRNTPVVEGQELYRHESRRGVWLLSGTSSVFPASIHGSMTLNEAEEAIESIARL